jgi:cytochrome P450
MNVARMEARIAFSGLLRRFRRLELAGPPERDRRIRFRGFRKLPLRVN